MLVSCWSLKLHIPGSCHKQGKALAGVSVFVTSRCPQEPAVLGQNEGGDWSQASCFPQATEFLTSCDISSPFLGSAHVLTDPSPITREVTISATSLWPSCIPPSLSHSGPSPQSPLSSVRLIHLLHHMLETVALVQEDSHGFSPPGLQPWLSDPSTRCILP